MGYALALCLWVTGLEAQVLKGDPLPPNPDSESKPVAKGPSLKPQEVWLRVEGFYQKIESFYLEFSQEVYWRRGYEVEASGGKIWFKKPHFLRWEYRYPEKLLILSDGQKVYFYSPEDQQVTIFSLKRAFSKTLLRLLSGQTRLQEEFQLIDGRPARKGYLLELKPRSDQDLVSKVRLLVVPESGKILEIWYWDTLGNLTHILFEKSEFNLKIEKSKFTFRPPDAVEIVKEEDL